MKKLEDLKVAIVCDSLDQYGGAEKIIEAFHELFPHAPIYTSFYNREKMVMHGFVDSDKIIITARFGKHPLLLKFAKYLFFLYPTLFEQFDFSEYDLVLSSSTRFAHGVITNADTLHICYLHSPSRYAWDYFQYKDGLHIHGLKRALYPFIVSMMRIWDRSAADRVDSFIANSHYTRYRIRKFYKRDAVVINPFIDMKRFSSVPTEKEGTYFLYLGRFIKWRKLEMIIEYFNESGQSLHMVGNGDKAYIEKLKRKAQANITFYEKQTNDQVVQHLQGCRALIWPSIEDFGIAPIEAQAAGKPVIALRRGGAIDSIKDKETGIFFDEQTNESFKKAMQLFERTHFSPENCIKQAQLFKKEKFLRQIRSFILSKYNESSTGT